jgi:hypothetical protein
VVLGCKLVLFLVFLCRAGCRHLHVPQNSRIPDTLNGLNRWEPGLEHCLCVLEVLTIAYALLIRHHVVAQSIMSCYPCTHGHTKKKCTCYKRFVVIMRRIVTSRTPITNRI